MKDNFLESTDTPNTVKNPIGSPNDTVLVWLPERNRQTYG